MNDILYYVRRAAQHRKLAHDANCDRARLAHLELVDSYERQIRTLRRRVPGSGAVEPAEEGPTRRDPVITRFAAG